jgi:hypothetical protein
MALISKFSLDDVYKQLKSQFRELRSNSLRLRAEAAAGPVSFSRVSAYLAFVTDSIALCDERLARFGGTAIADYAKAQEDDLTYDPATEYGAMKTAARAVTTHITTAIPANSAHTVVNGKTVEPSFSTAQTATLRALLDTLVGTIGAP